VKLATADAIADELVGTLVADLDLGRGVELLLLVNGLGGTPAMELYVMVAAARRILEGRGLKVSRYLVGSLVTSLDMAGCSITLSVLEDRLRGLGDAPVH